MNREVEDGMGFAGLVCSSADEREIERLSNRVRDMRAALDQFGVHADQCRKWVRGPHGACLSNLDCTCGLDAAKRAPK